MDIIEDKIATFLNFSRLFWYLLQSDPKISSTISSTFSLFTISILSYFEYIICSSSSTFWIHYMLFFIYILNTLHALLHLHFEYITCSSSSYLLSLEEIKLIVIKNQLLYTSYEIQLRNWVTQNHVTLQLTNSKIFIEVPLLSY